MSIVRPFRLDRRPDDQFVLLRNIERWWETFYTSIADRTEQEIVRLYDGTVAYYILGYADSTEDAQLQLYGRVMK